MQRVLERIPQLVRADRDSWSGHLACLLENVFAGYG
jgi:hypothetical protein